MSAQGFQVIPEALIFRNTDTKTKDSLEVSVRNTQNKPTRIRFSLPQACPFSLISGQTFMLPPGLSTSIKIYCNAQSNSIEKSVLTISSPDETFQIPVISYPPSPNVQFDQKMINMGTMSSISSKVQKFSFTNFGTSDASFKIKCDNNFIQINQKTGILGVNKTFETFFTFNPPASGSYSFHLVLSVDNNVDPIPPLPVTAEVVDQSILLRYNKQDLDCLDFGPLFYGQKKSLSIQIVNNSSSKRSFTIRDPISSNCLLNKGTAATFSHKSIFRTSSITYEQQQMQDATADNNQSLFSISPQSGDINANSEANITITLQTPYKLFAEDLETIYSSYSEVYITGTDLILPFKMTGCGVRASYSISCVDFDFQKQKVKSKSVKMLSITNESKELPIQFQIKQIAHFHFIPSSGTIKPKCVKDIQVIFSPNSLGLFNSTASIIFGQNMITRTINLSGESVAELDDIINNSQPFKRKTLMEIPRSDCILNPEYALNHDEVRDKFEKRQLFDSYLTDMEKEREKIEFGKQMKKQAKKEVIEILKQSDKPYSKQDFREMIVNQIKKNMEVDIDTVNLGIEPHEGLVPPNPSIRIKEPMSMPSDTYRIRNVKQKGAFDDRVLIKRKFKSKPTKKIEIVECSNKLLRAQLLLVIPSSQIIHFGTVSVFSKEVRSFQLNNNIPMHILAEIIPSKEIKNSKPLSQVIPPNQVAGFDIVLDTSKEGAVQSTLQYKINQMHTYSISIIADVIPIDVTMSSPVMNFTLQGESFQNYSSKTLMLTNNSTSIAKYQMNGFYNSIFTVHDTTGLIQPFSSASIEITYKPDTSPHSETYIDISIAGGKNLILKLIGDTGKPNFVLNRKSVDFGLIPLGVSITQTIQIRNDSDDDGIFAITPSFTDILHITPPKGRVKRRSTVELTITVNCENNGKFDIPIQISICGSLPISFDVIGDAEVPQVQLNYDTLDFGPMYIGSAESKLVSIENIGIIPASLELNMAQYKMFHIKYSSQNITQMTYSSQQNLNEDRNFGFKYRIGLQPHQSAEFELVYCPTHPGKVRFNLPLVLENNPKSIEYTQPIVCGEGVISPLFPSALELSFGSVPLHDPLNPNNRPKTQTLVLTNTAAGKISFRFDVNSEIFQLHQKSGTIDYACSASIFVHFKPLEPIPYSLLLPLYAKTEIGETLVAQIQVTGIGTPRIFVPSTNYLSLPIVPLGIKAESEIEIHNIGRIPLELEAKLAINETQFPILINFPQGKKMNFNTLRLPLHISFTSTKPISFSTVVLIVDKKGNNCAFTILITTDNSIFTLYNFLTLNQYTISSEIGKPIMLKLQEVINQNDVLSQFLSISDFSQTKPMPSTLTNDFVQFIIRFLNECVLTNPIENFPQDFIEHGNSIIAEIIKNLTGKNPPNELTNANNNSLKRNQKLIHFLMSQGALLANVKPEFLVSQPEFMEIMKEKITLQILGIDYYGAPPISSFQQKDIDLFTNSQIFNTKLLEMLQNADSFYHSLSLESWTIIVLQIIKLYMFGKLLDNDKFRQIPGVKDSLEAIHLLKNEETFNDINKNNNSLSNSNVYSPAESLLLKWASIHYINVNRNQNTPIINYASFSNSQILLSIVQSHITQEKIDLNGGFFELIKRLQSIQIEFVNDTDLLKPNPIVYAITIQQMMKYLPHYLPSSKVIIKAPMNQITHHAISVINPSNSTIIYDACLKGSNNFTLKQTSFELGPRKSFDLIIEYFPKMHYPETATLTLIPSTHLKSNFGENSEFEKTSFYVPQPPSSAIKTDQKTGTRRHARRMNKKSTTFSSQKNSAMQSKANSPQNGKRDIIANTRDTTHINLNNNANKSASTVVISLVTEITYSTPYKSLMIESPVYKSSNLKFSVTNITKQSGTFQVYYKIFELKSEDENPKNLAIQMKAFMDNPNLDASAVEDNDDFDNILSNYLPFILDRREVTFQSNDDMEEVQIGADFFPISLKSYRCLILFRNEQLGEILYEIKGIARLPEVINSKCKCKIESKSQCKLLVPIDIRNNHLFNAIACMQTKLETYGIFVSDAKFSDLVSKHAKDLAISYTKNVKPINFDVTLSSDYFKCFNKFTLTNNPKNEIELTFLPTAPGEFPCKLVLQSQYDIRVYSVSGISIPENRYATVEFDTIASLESKQEIPIPNNSELNWFYRVSYSGSSTFSGPSNFVIYSHTSYTFTLSFLSAEVGTFEGQVILENTTKEFQTIYSLKGVAGDPPAIEKLEYNIKARQKFTTSVPVPSFPKTVKNIKVSTDVPIMDFSPELIPSTVTNKEIELYATRSGISVGTLTFTDSNSRAYGWYIIEVNVEQPDPEETIYVSTVTRKPIDIQIPVYNPTDHSVTFEVEYNDDELIGEKYVTVNSLERKVYTLHLNPLRASQRTTSISFYHDIEGEYIYNLDINVLPPENNIIAPLSAVIGEEASTIVYIDNPLDANVIFKVENDNPTNFRVIVAEKNPIINVLPNVQMPIEIKFIPSSIGIVTTANIVFKSRLLGDWVYKLSGTGKPPHPTKPIRVKSMIQVGSSGQIRFCNPFPFKAKFEVMLQTETSFISILTKRKVFTLYEFNEEHQIVFSFQPKNENIEYDRAEYNATILVSTIDMSPTIHWSYPIIGEIITGAEKHATIIKGKANITNFQKLTVELNGEKVQTQTTLITVNDSYSRFHDALIGTKTKNENQLRNVDDYVVYLSCPSDLFWIKKYISILPLEIVDKYINIGNNRVTAVLKICLRRPIHTKDLGVVVEKISTGQKWKTNFELNIEQNAITRIISMESPINVATTHKIKIHEQIQVRTEISAYFLPNSSLDLSVSPSKAIIEPTLSDEVELPFNVTYFPKMYGKMMKGFLVIESEEFQLMYEVHGRMPNYVPPKCRKSGRIDTSMPEGAKPTRKSTRNFVKENIESIKSFQKSGQLKLKTISENSNPRNRTKVIKLSQNPI